MIMRSKMKNTVKQHPFSTVLFVIYFAISILQGSLELFLVSFLAAFGAYVLELLFCANQDQPKLYRPSPLLRIADQAEAEERSVTLGIRRQRNGSRF